MIALELNIIFLISLSVCVYSFQHLLVYFGLLLLTIFMRTVRSSTSTGAGTSELIQRTFHSHLESFKYILQCLSK